MSHKIVLLNTWHKSYDDRVFYHQAKSLESHGFEVQIISTVEDLSIQHGNITINSFYGKNLTQKDKTDKIINYLDLISPDLIICDSPLAVFASANCKKKHNIKIIYDITEWYPSKIHVQHKKGIHKILKYIILITLNLLAGLKSDSFLFGEYYKSIEFRKLFFWKKHLRLPYYPDLNYIQYYPLTKITTEINLLYCGFINTDKGIDSVIEAIKIVSIKCQGIQFKLKIIGNFYDTNDQAYFNNLIADIPQNISFNIVEFLPYPEFTKAIGDTDLFFDLRQVNFENSHCLPIKLFYYLACGRPVLYSNLKAIRKEIKNINFGYLCDPNDIESIAGHIKDYIDNPGLYAEHAANALNISKSTYNWKAVENDFIKFIDNQFKKK